MTAEILYLHAITFIASLFIFNWLYRKYFYSFDRLEKIRERNPRAYKLILKKMMENEKGWFPLKWLWAPAMTDKLKQLYDQIHIDDFDSNEERQVEEIRI